MGPSRLYRSRLSSTRVGFSLCLASELILLLSMPRLAKDHPLSGWISAAHLWAWFLLDDKLTLPLKWPGLFLSIPCWMTLRALANFSIFSFCFFRCWRMSFHPSAPGEVPQSTFPTVFNFKSIDLFISTYSSSLRPTLRLAGPGIHRQTGLARSNTGSDICVQYALPDQGPKRSGSWYHMAHHVGRARLTSASPPRGPGETPLSYEALSVGYHTETIVWTFLGYRLRRFCSVPQEIPYTSSFLAAFKRYPVYRLFSHIQRTHITVIRRCHSFTTLIPRRHSRTHF